MIECLFTALNRLMSASTVYSCLQAHMLRKELISIGCPGHERMMQPTLLLYQLSEPALLACHRGIGNRVQHPTLRIRKVRSRLTLVENLQTTGKKEIPRFYFPSGPPLSPSTRSHMEQKIDSLLKRYSQGVTVPAIKELFTEVGPQNPG